ncbi:hypothetical protein PHYSODRAFT_345045 [Phytophthora sojae]|uniref:C-factor n=1 Tax=Phytophthora sojae (strain P6497) TaxID=1094619 RepID=G4Z1J3_PHYSP|nr:hypothetical protein PHYSODRAFT_345045 [Phytophthora sojae]EGZ25904.1 hypothetical protein PHYSODRAFT_345045 [Phytophthora sojae]|eukprot:XP_009521192.1 hypothetical protein PHYSODRAFT_345045 [Phytophthora sojae]
MGSITDNGSGGYYGYRASKTALNMLTKSLAVDLEKEKIGCLLLHPGYVNTAMVGFTGSVSSEDSVKGLTKIIARAKIEDSAKMFHFEKGDVLPWKCHGETPVHFELNRRDDRILVHFPKFVTDP